MARISVCESDGERIAGGGKRKPTTIVVSFFIIITAIYMYSPSSLLSQSFFSVSMAGTHCRPQLHVLAVKHSVSQLVRAIMATVKLHCLRDNAWLTWSTSEPDILLSLHHNTTTQTDMAGPLISRAGLTDLLCAHCNGCMVSSNVPRIRWRDQKHKYAIQCISAWDVLLQI